MLEKEEGVIFPRATILSIEEGEKEPKTPSDIMCLIRNNPTRKEFARGAKGLGYFPEQIDYYANLYNLKDEEPKQELKQEPNKAPASVLSKNPKQMVNLFIEYVMKKISKDMFYSRALLEAGYRRHEAEGFCRGYYDEHPDEISRLAKMYQ